jgi:phosphate/sulfate permease
VFHSIFPGAKKKEGGKNCKYLNISTPLIFFDVKMAWWETIKVMLSILIILGIISLIVSMGYFFKINSEIKYQSEQISSRLEKTDSLLASLESDLSILQSIPSDIDDINQDIDLVKKDIDKTGNKLDSILQTRLNLTEANKEMIGLLSSYQPISNYYINSSKKDIQTAFSTIVIKNIYQLIISFSVGLFSGSILSLSIYFVWKKVKNSTNHGN